MSIVYAAETAVRRAMHPDKINLASFGNMVPHLHWHVIPRFRGDRHFPRPVWAEPSRGSAERHAPPDRNALARALKLRMDQMT